MPRNKNPTKQFFFSFFHTSETSHVRLFNIIFCSFFASYRKVEFSRPTVRSDSRFNLSRMLSSQNEMGCCLVFFLFFALGRRTWHHLGCSETRSKDGQSHHLCGTPQRRLTPPQSSKRRTNGSLEDESISTLQKSKPGMWFPPTVSESRRVLLNQLEPTQKEFPAYDKTGTAKGLAHGVKAQHGKYRDRHTETHRRIFPQRACVCVCRRGL